MSLKHHFQSSKPDGSDASLVRPSNWNEEHEFVGGKHGSFLIRDVNDPYGSSWLDDEDEGLVLLSGGEDEVAVFGKVDLTVHVSGVLPQANMDLSGIVFGTRTVNGHPLSADVTVSKSDVGLSNVENTALSTWAGSTALTTTGVVSTGTWSGLFGNVSGANLTNLTAANIAAGTAGINISGNAATATSATTAGSASTATLAAAATTLATPRAIYGNNFDGSAALAQIIASTFGGTGNGFTKFSGPATSEKTFTLPDASATILTSASAVTAAQGGTGIQSYAIGDLIYASTTSALSKLADVATGSVLVSGGVGVAPAWSATPTLTSLTLGTLTFSGGQSLVGTTANVTELYNSTTAQNVRVSNQRTSAANYEYIKIGWNANIAQVFADNVGGTARNMQIGTEGGGTTLFLRAAGTDRWGITSSGHFLAQADNTYDIGASGATRPRTGYFGTSVVVGSTTIAPTLATINGSIQILQSGYLTMAATAGGSNQSRFGSATHGLWNFEDVAGATAGFQINGQVDLTAWFKSPAGADTATVKANKLQITGLAAFVASDKYVTVDSSGNFHVSALGPAS